MYKKLYDIVLVEKSRKSLLTPTICKMQNS